MSDKEAAAECDLRTRLAAAEAERDHWKSNHDAVFQRFEAMIAGAINRAEAAEAALAKAQEESREWRADVDRLFAAMAEKDDQVLTEAAADSLSKMIIEWVEGGIASGKDWRPELPRRIALRLVWTRNPPVAIDQVVGGQVKTPEAIRAEIDRIQVALARYGVQWSASSRYGLEHRVAALEWVLADDEPPVEQEKETQT